MDTKILEETSYRSFPPIRHVYLSILFDIALLTLTCLRFITTQSLFKNLYQLVTQLWAPATHMERIRREYPFFNVLNWTLFPSSISHYLKLWRGCRVKHGSKLFDCFQGIAQIYTTIDKRIAETIKYIIQKNNFDCSTT